MARYPTFPPLFDEAHTLSILKLKEWGYLRPGNRQSGVITWSNNGCKTGSIGVTVNTLVSSPYLEPDYKHRDKPLKYRLLLVNVPSNLGKGQVWYFLCPHTGKRCRKLYCIGERFLHREAYIGCFYEKQTYSHNIRKQYKFFEKIFNSDNIHEQLYSKYFKKYYAGKPTKRYLKLMHKVKQSEQFTLGQIKSLRNF